MTTILASINNKDLNESYYDHTTSKCIISKISDDFRAGEHTEYSTMVNLPLLSLTLKKCETSGKIKGDIQFIFVGYGVRITFEFVKKN